MKPLSRRDFLAKGTALLATLGIGGPLLLGRDSKLFALGDGPDTDSLSPVEKAKPVKSPVLVVIQLSGGNDGINTLIPYGQGAYYDARPMLQIGQKDVLALNGEVGLHPSLAGLKGLYDRGKLAVVQGVGYPDPDRSHFRSMEIWQTGEPGKRISSGWLARYAELSLAKDVNLLKALQIGSSPNKAFLSGKVNVPVIQSLDTYNFFDPKTPKTDQNRIAKAFLDMYDPTRQLTQIQVACRSGKDAYASVEAIQAMDGIYPNKVQYPKSGIAKDLQLVSKMLAGNAGTRVFYVQLGGFDDHAQEKEQHAKLLKDLDMAVKAFYDDLEALGLQDRVVTMVFSEFGRRVKENGSGGTDHGTAAPMFIMGGSVKGGLYGGYPKLTDLDKGDLKYEVDFRSVYYSLIEDWMKGDAKGTLGKTFEKFSFV